MAHLLPSPSCFQRGWSVYKVHFEDTQYNLEMIGFNSYTSEVSSCAGRLLTAARGDTAAYFTAAPSCKLSRITSLFGGWLNAALVIQPLLFVAPTVSLQSKSTVCQGQQQRFRHESFRSFIEERRNKNNWTSGHSVQSFHQQEDQVMCFIGHVGKEKM